MIKALLLPTPIRPLRTTPSRTCCVTVNTNATHHRVMLLLGEGI